MIWALSGRRNHQLAGWCNGIAEPESAASCTVDAVRQTQGWKRREIAPKGGDYLPVFSPAAQFTEILTPILLYASVISFTICE